MAVIGISLLVASVVIFCLRPPTWLPRFLANLRLGRISGPPALRPKSTAASPGSDENKDRNRQQVGHADRQVEEFPKQPVPTIQEPGAHQDAADQDGAPAQPAPISILEAHQEEEEDAGQGKTHDDEQATPKASAVPRDDPVPRLDLPFAGGALPQQQATTIPSFTTTPPPPRLNIVPEPPRSAAELMPPPPPLKCAPINTTATTTSRSASTPSSASASASASALMPPPPAPKTITKIPRPSGIPQPRSPTAVAAISSPSSSSSSAPPRRIPTLNGTASPTSTRNLPIPRRGGAPPPRSSSGGGGGLAPPPTATSIPRKPSRQVTLEPGHSPLDWARLAQSPTSDLRGLPADAPYLRVTPSMLKQQNGRKGRDAWTVYGGKVYNISPYIPFHPGGGPELLRGAGKDGTRLFAEVHPWVNYETMLQSCLIGLLVEEHEAANEMEEMD